jgi:hypothetical protein
MKSPLIFKKFPNIISLIAGLNIFTSSYASFSSLKEDSSESSESGKIAGSKRSRDENSDSPKIKTKKQKIKAREESKSLSSKDELSSEEKSGLTENLGSPNIASKEDIKDVFYIFNVGQGNSQLAIYSEDLEEPFGVLYDCGSSAENVHPKIAKARSSRVYNTILSKKEIEEGNSLDFGISNFNVSLLPISLETSDKKSSQISSRTSSGNISYSGERIDLIDVSNFIKETLEDHYIKYLFVILSHPDKDHINLIPSVIPEGVKSLFLLGGDFLQESDSANSKLKQDIQKLFKFFKERNNSEFSLPYFWNFSKYNGIRTGIKQYIFEQDGGLLALSKESRQSMDSAPSPLYGSLFDLLNLMDEKEGRAISPYLAPLFEQKNIKQKLDNIYIWGLNKYASDINDQSIIVSLRMPSLGKSFICTGDAREDIFVDMYQFIRNQEKYQIDAENKHCSNASLHNDSEKNTVILVLPHHGSFENWSLRMLDLFKPDALVVSSGAGMFPHPSNKLIVEYKSKYRLNPTSSNVDFKTSIWNKYETVNDLYYLSFLEKSSKIDKQESNRNKNLGEKNQKETEKITKVDNKNNNTISAVYKKIKDQKNDIPIFCTNTLGSIKITKDVFASEYINLVQYNENYYKINLSKHFDIDEAQIKTHYKHARYAGSDFYIPLKKEGEKSDSILLKIIRTIKLSEKDLTDKNKRGEKIKRPSKKEVAYYYEGIKVIEGEMR